MPKKGDLFTNSMTGGSLKAEGFGDGEYQLSKLLRKTAGNLELSARIC
jgi:hypothetical protein